MHQPDMAEHLRYYLSIASRVGHFKRKDPQEYLARLRFHRAVSSLSDYGL